MLTLVIVSAVVPVFVRVTVEAALDDPTDWLAKVTLEGERTTVADAPVPVIGIVCTAPLPLSVRVIVPAIVPLVVGVKLTLMVQLAPDATPPPQLLVCE
jgi:hypothetical protein